MKTNLTLLNLIVEIEIKAKINCNVKEAMQLIKEGLNEQHSHVLMQALAGSLQERFDFGPDKQTVDATLKALERVSLDAILLLAQIVSDEGWFEDDRYVVEFDDVQLFDEFCHQDEKVVRRKISSRIGGLRKITDSIQAPALATIEKGFDAKLIEVRHWAKPIIEEFVRQHRSAWVSHLKARGFHDDPLAIVKN